METVDKSKETNLGGFTLLKPKMAAGKCEECGRVHPAERPHDAGSLFYQYQFKEKHGRWPTWEDAMAHCPEAIQAAWREQLENHGALKEKE